MGASFMIPTQPVDLLISVKICAVKNHLDTLHSVSRSDKFNDKVYNYHDYMSQKTLYHCGTCVDNQMDDNNYLMGDFNINPCIVFL